MPDLPKTKLSEKPVATNLLPGDRLVVLRRGQDEPDAARRNLTAPLAVVQAWLGISSATQHLVAPAMLLAAAQATLAAGEPFDEGVQYPLIGDWNAVGDGDQVVYLHTASTTQFRTNGTLFRFGHAPQEVLVDVAAGTAVASGVDAYTVAETDALLATKGDLGVQQQHSQQLATLAARGANLYAHYADNTVAPFTDLDSFLAAAGLHGGTLRLEGEATALSVSVDNRGSWPAFWDAQGSTIVVPAGAVLKSSAAGAENLTFGNFYLDGSGLYRISSQLDQATPAGRASRLFDGFSNIPVDNPANVVVLDGGYYKKITGKGKYYLTGTVEVDDQTEASNVVDLRGGSGAGTVKTVNGAAPDAAGNVTLASRDLYGYSAAKRSQVFGLFTTANQVKAVDVALAGDTSTGIGSQIPDLPNGILYLLVPDPDNPMPGPNGSVIGTPTWLRTRS
jgi:hypothetical protein